jgi:hypothetical protein
MKQINNPIYAWNSQFDSNDITAHTTIKDMNKSDRGYYPDDNAKNVARFIEYSLPGNTVDVLLDSIASELLVMLNSNNWEVLKSPYDIQNRIRAALNQLANMGDIG